MGKGTVNKWTLGLVALLISLLFLVMIRQFIMPLILAGIFSALCYPIYNRFEKWFGGRHAPASAVTIIIVVCVVIVPLSGLLGIVASQALKIGAVAKPWITQKISEPNALSNLIQSLPFYDSIEPYRSQIITKTGELVGSMSSFIIDKVSSATIGTLNIIISVFIMLYCMFFFLMEGEGILKKILYYLPLEDDDERRLLDKFTSVTRATLKGTLVIGVLQGGLAGLAFAVLGIPSAVFWGTIMAVLSVIPSVGSAIVWLPAVILLIATGHIAKGIILFVFCAFVVGSMDNLLRPKLVGRDTEMHELMILFGTLGGIFMFGMIGMIIGPVIAALFVTVWDIYGIEFKEILPEVKIFSQKEKSELCGDDSGEEIK
jgi:predicted PurR-regulated permease PerM